MAWGPGCRLAQLLASPSDFTGWALLWSAQELSVFFTVRTLTFVATPMVAALWRPLVGWLRQGSAQAALASFLILNLLNVADALLTEFAIGRGQAEELNPLVRSAGWPVKIGVVAVASGLLYRYRPRVLVWPALVLGAVLLWHLVGLAVGV